MINRHTPIGEAISRPWRITLIGFSVLLVFSVLIYGYLDGATTFRDSETYDKRVLDCQGRALNHLAGLGANYFTVQDLEDISSLCYDDLRRVDSLSESNIRRGLYIHQRFENNVILGMVVLITLSGVALAAVQLLTSYTLASTGHLQGDGVTDLTLEQGKLAIKSSVTGLVVLVVSLAFFWIYIIYVYRIVPSADAKVIAPTTSAGPIQKSPTSARASPAAPRGVELESGGLGPPPGQAPPPR